ncbi:MAG: LPS-assembly protein LptD, partial [Candidatus Omnitrophica bacterium]|nr:LPS-assembly protein LptD [Candidatus Omnitrophota bacterium]
PTFPPSKLQIFDEIDNIERNHKLNFEVANKWQTKRNNESIDLANLRVSTDYNLERNNNTSKRFSDFLLDLELIPFAWLRIESDANYDPHQENFKTVNFDMVTNFSKGSSLGMGYRYERKGGKELTTDFNWHFNHKWQVRIYERYQFSRIKGRGLKEQEYNLGRDLHCWKMNFVYNISKAHGHTFWLVFRLKAFPEVELEFEQSYRTPKQAP